MSLEFLVTALIVVVMPGTGVIYTLAIGLGRGFKASAAAALGCTFGIVPAAMASIIGLAALFHTSALAFQLVKYAGVAYLLYMAWGMLKSGSPLSVERDRTGRTYWRTAMDGLLLNVLNPKLSLFFLAFLPQFVAIDDPNGTVTMMGLAAVFMLLTFVVFLGYGACAALARDYVIARPSVMAWFKRSFAAAFGLLGLRLALSER